VDRSAVYFSDKRLPLDPDSVEVVSTYFLKDRTSVWYYRFDATGTAMERLEGADAPSFRVLGLESRDLSWAGDPSWAVDVNHVYDYRTRAVLPGADAATFEPLNAWYAKDRAAVYGIAIAWEKNGTGMPTPAAVIAGADSASFRLLPSAGKDEPDAQDATGIYFDGRRLPK
jgi:hypothetical protein